MIKDCKTRDIIKVSLSGEWPGADRNYTLEGRVLVRLLKKWDDLEEKWRSYWMEWCGVEPFVLVLEGNAPEEIGDDGLPKEVKEEIEWIIAASLR